MPIRHQAANRQPLALVADTLEIPPLLNASGAAKAECHGLGRVNRLNRGKPLTSRAATVAQDGSAAFA